MEALFTPSPPAANPVTSSKKHRLSADATDEDSGSVETLRKKAKVTAAKGEGKKKRTPAKTASSSRAIPRSYADCSDADKKLLDMRDKGSTWIEIRAAIEQITGEKTGMSTLPNRYTRLKSNITVIKEEDNAKMIEAKVEIETAFEEEKWSRIAEAVAQKGGDTYKGDALKRQYKKLMGEVSALPPPGVKDMDFRSEQGDDE